MGVCSDFGREKKKERKKERKREREREREKESLFGRVEMGDGRGEKGEGRWEMGDRRGERRRWERKTGWLLLWVKHSSAAPFDPIRRFTFRKSCGLDE